CGHELVAVPGYPHIFEPHECGLDPCLIKPLGYAVGVRAVITRFTGHIENRDALQVNELMRRLFLDPAGNELRPVRFVLANSLQFGGALDWRIVSDWHIGPAPHA